MMKRRSVSLIAIPARVLVITLVLLASLTLAHQATAQEACGISPDEVGRLADLLVQLGKTEEAEERILDPRLHPAGTPLEVSPKELLDTKVQVGKTRRQIQDTKHQLLDLVIRMNQCCEKLRERLCPPTSFKRNEAVGLFAIIREDAQPKRFNTYGATVDYTRFLNPAIGITGDFNANFRTQNGADLKKVSFLGGVTIIPFPSAKTKDKVTVSTHALLGVSHFSSTAGSVSSTDNAFTMKLGAALDVSVTRNFFIRPIQFDYAPTFFGGNTQKNLQFGFGAGFRFGRPKQRPISEKKATESPTSLPTPATSEKKQTVSEANACEIEATLVQMRFRSNGLVYPARFRVQVSVEGDSKSNDFLLKKNETRTTPFLPLVVSADKAKGYCDKDIPIRFNFNIEVLGINGNFEPNSTVEEPELQTYHCPSQKRHVTFLVVRRDNALNAFYQFEFEFNVDLKCAKASSP